MSAQQRVYDAVCARGYRAEWSSGQFIARQVVKCYEELCEALRHIRTATQHTQLNAFIWETGQLEHVARSLFDDRKAWGWSELTPAQQEQLGGELADVVVTVFCAAQELGIDVVQAAIDKAEADIGRGVR